MPKISQCDRCLLYCNSVYLVCAVHPDGVDTESCLDFREDPDAEPEELWAPEGCSYYDGELICYKPRLTPEEQLHILDTHPFFTGVCPECGQQFDKENPPKVHWDCPKCGWLDDSV